MEVVLWTPDPAHGPKSGEPCTRPLSGSQTVGQWPTSGSRPNFGCGEPLYRQSPKSKGFFTAQQSWVCWPLVTIMPETETEMHYNAWKVSLALQMWSCSEVSWSSPRNKFETWVCTEDRSELSHSFYISWNSPSTVFRFKLLWPMQLCVCIEIGSHLSEADSSLPECLQTLSLDFISQGVLGLLQHAFPFSLLGPFVYHLSKKSCKTGKMVIW